MDEEAELLDILLFYDGVIITIHFSQYNSLWVLYFWQLIMRVCPRVLLLESGHILNLLGTRPRNKLATKYES